MTRVIEPAIRFALLFMLGFVIASALVARADGTHYEQSDWSADPRLVADSTMPAPFTGWENSVFTGAFPWNQVAGAWVSIDVRPLIPLAENIAIGNVPMGEIYVVAYAGGVDGPLATEATDYNYLLFQIQRSRIRMNKSLGGFWVNTNMVPPLKYDYVSVLVHEIGHSMGVQHRTVGMNGTPDGYGTCAGSTNNNVTWINQATMCEFIMAWTGAGNILSNARSLHNHEKDDYAANY